MRKQPADVSARPEVAAKIGEAGKARKARKARKAGKAANDGRATGPTGTEAMPLILYSTDGCHLCEEAEALLRAERDARRADLAWTVVDIAHDDALFERYGWHIPVLRREDGEELNWPFDAGGLRSFLGS